MEKTKFQLAVEKMIQRDGNLRKTAKNILDLKLVSICGLTSDDLPDVCEIAEAIDNIEDALLDGINENDIKFELSLIDIEFIESIVY